MSPPDLIRDTEYGVSATLAYSQADVDSSQVKALPDNTTGFSPKFQDQSIGLDEIIAIRRAHLEKMARQKQTALFQNISYGRDAEEPSTAPQTKEFEISDRLTSEHSGPRPNFQQAPYGGMRVQKRLFQAVSYGASQEAGQLFQGASNGQANGNGYLFQTAPYAAPLRNSNIRQTVSDRRQTPAAAASSQNVSYGQHEPQSAMFQSAAWGREGPVSNDGMDAGKTNNANGTQCPRKPLDPMATTYKPKSILPSRMPTKPQA